MTEMDTRLVACAYDVVGKVTEGRCYYQTYDSAVGCREAMRHSSTDVSVIVFDHTVDISPINMAAALCGDKPDRDIYLMVDELSGSLSSRAHAAGIRRLVNREQALEMISLALHLRDIQQQPDYLRRHGNAESQGKVNSMEATNPRTPTDYKKTNNLFKANNPVKTNNSAANAVSSEHPDLDFDEMLDELEEDSRLAAVSSQVSQRDLKLYTFISGRGGVGKSTVTLLLAIMAQRRGMRVALLDLDLQFGDLHFMLDKGQNQQFICNSLEELISARKLPELRAGTLLLASAPLQPEKSEAIASQLPELVHRLNEKADIVLANTGTVWTEIQAILAQHSRLLVFMMDQRATSIQGCKQAMELCIRMKVPSTRFAFLLNRCGKASPISTLDASLALAGADVWQLVDGGNLVDELLALGAPEELLAEQSSLVDSLDALLDVLMGQGSPFVTSKSEKTSGRIPGLPDLSGIRRLLSGDNHVTP